MRGLGPRVVPVVGPTGVLFLDFLHSGIQLYILYILLIPYLCFISFIYLDLYLGDDTSII